MILNSRCWYPKMIHFRWIEKEKFRQYEDDKCAEYTWFCRDLTMMLQTKHSSFLFLFSDLSICASFSLQCLLNASLPLPLPNTVPRLAMFSLFSRKNFWPCIISFESHTNLYEREGNWVRLLKISVKNECLELQNLMPMQNFTGRWALPP